MNKTKAAMAASVVFLTAGPTAVGAVSPPNDRIGIPQGETFTIVSPKPTKKKCHTLYTWGRNPVVVKRCKKVKQGR